MLVRKSKKKNIYKEFFYNLAYFLIKLFVNLVVLPFTEALLASVTEIIPISMRSFHALLFVL